ncbi:carbohydrate ABC transporter permease [Candidatus Aerophobetes bacterium]|nr:carbohydrate ABC transporter permease [Candidatus Aerophobetes bacterium]
MPSVLFFYWMVLISLREQLMNIVYPPPLLPIKPVLDSYAKVFAKSPFLHYTLNSFIVAGGSTIISLIVGLPAAYSIARYKQNKLATVVLVSRMIPGLSLLLPWFIFFRTLNLTDTHLALVLAHMIVTLPLVIWVMISFFEGVPRDLEDAALIDGCSLYGTFYRVVLPLVKPGTVVVSILSFILSWNIFIFAVVLSGSRTRILPVAVYNIMNYEEIIWGELAAAAIVVTLPALILTCFIAKHLIAGLSLGAIKG